MKLPVVGAFVALAFGCQSAATAPHTAQSAIESDPRTPAVADLDAKTVALVLRVKDEWRAYCSGVWVSPREIVTAYHCVHDEETDEVEAVVSFAQYADGAPNGIASSSGAFVSKTDPAHDLALLVVPGVFVHGVAGLDYNPYTGESVAAMGHSVSRLIWSYSTGVVASVRKLALVEDNLDPEIVWVQSTTAISPGNSGGGLFDTRGNLLGVCSRGFTRGQNLNLFVHVAHVRALLGK